MEELGFSSVAEIMGSGIYALLSRGVVVYVGQSKCMLTRVYTHYYNKSHRRNRKWMSFDDVWIRPCAVNGLDRLEREMILHFQPRYNIRKPQETIPLDIKALVASLVPQMTTHPLVVGTIRRI